MRMAITLVKLLLKLSPLRRDSTIVTSPKQLKLGSPPAKKGGVKKVLGAQAKMHAALPF